MADYRLTIRRDTQANWASANPVLAQGEPGFETDTNNLKVGDGTSHWNALPYYAPTISSVASVVSAEVRANGTISAGDVVAYDGASGGKILAVAADASDPLFTDQLVLGVSPVSAVANDDISIVEYGIVGSIDTSAFLEGDILYLDKTVPGGLTSTRPTAPDSVIAVAVAVTAQNNGTLLVAPRIGGDIKELNDVSYAMTPSDGDVLTYNSGVWSSAASYVDSDVDAHLNTSTATTGQVLSWDGADYDWVDQSGGTPAPTGPLPTLLVKGDVAVDQDDSLNGYTFTTTGTPTLNTTDKVFGASSISFPRTAKLTTVENVDFGSNPFCIEAWLKPGVLATRYWGSNSSAAGSFLWLFINANGTTGIRYAGANRTSTSSLSTTAWNHVACVFDGTNIKVYFNGVEEHSASASQNTGSDAFHFGGTSTDISGDSAWYEGLMDDFRITIGDPVYTGNFTPAEHPIPTSNPLGAEETDVTITTPASGDFLKYNGSRWVNTSTSEVISLTPLSANPSSPSAGDLYFNSTTSKLKCFDGTTWQDCF